MLFLLLGSVALLLWALTQIQPNIRKETVGELIDYLSFFDEMVRTHESAVANGTAMHEHFERRLKEISPDAMLINREGDLEIWDFKTIKE